MMRILLVVCLLLTPLQAAADPVSLIVAAIGLTGAAATIATIAGNLLLGAALSSRAKRKARKARARQIAEYNANLQARTGNIISPTGPVKKIYGEPAASYVNIVDSFHSGARDEFMHLVCVWANHSVQSIDEIYIDGKPVGPLDANGWCTEGDFCENRGDRTRTINFAFGADGLAAKPADFIEVISAFSALDNGGFDSGNVLHEIVVSGANLVGPPSTVVALTYKYRDVVARVNIQKHLGNGSDVADAYLISCRPDLWTVNHKCTGNAYFILTLSLDFPRFQGGPGEITAIGKGKSDIYNFVTQGLGYTANPIRCTADHLRSREGGGVQLAQFDASWAVMQQVADELVYLAPASVPVEAFNAWRLRTGGYPERFRADGIITSDMQRENALEAFEAAFAGELVEGAGVWRVQAGVWTTPVLSITDADRRGPIEQVRGGTPGDQVYNSSHTTYAPRNAVGGKAIPADVFVNESLKAEDGGRERNAQVDTTLIADAQRLKQVQRIKVEGSRGGQIIRYMGDLRLWPVQSGDRIYVSDSDWQIVNKAYTVIDKGSSLDSPVVLDLEEDSPLYYNLADDAVGLDPANNAMPDVLATPPAPLNLQAQSGSNLLRLLSDGSVVSTVRASWVLPSNGYVIDGGSTELQYKLATDLADSWVNVPPVEGASATADISPAPDGAYILIRARHRSYRGIPGLWGTIAHLVIGKTEPPPPLDNLKVLEQPGGVRQIFWRYQNPPADLFSFELAYAPGNVRLAFQDMLPLTAKDRDARQVESFEPSGDGVYTFAIRAVDRSENPSSPIYYTVTLIADQFANVDAAYFPHQSGWPDEKTGCYINQFTLTNAGIDTWANSPGATWGAVAGKTWRFRPSSPISYAMMIDRQANAPRALRAASLSRGVTVVEMRSSVDNMIFTPWAEIPSAAVSARYYQIRWSVSGSSPELYRAQIIFYT